MAITVGAGSENQNQPFNLEALTKKIATMPTIWAIVLAA
jgi:hypothetical protein